MPQQNGSHFEFQDGCHTKNVIKMSADMSKYAKIRNNVQFVICLCNK